MPTSPTRGVRRTPTGDSINFGLLVDGLDIDESTGASSDDMKDCKKPAAKETFEDSPRRVIRRAPTGDENSFAIMVLGAKDTDPSKPAESKVGSAQC